MFYHPASCKRITSVWLRIIEKISANYVRRALIRRLLLILQGKFLTFSILCTQPSQLERGNPSHCTPGAQEGLPCVFCSTAHMCFRSGRGYHYMEMVVLGEKYYESRLSFRVCP